MTKDFFNPLDLRSVSGLSESGVDAGASVSNKVDMNSGRSCLSTGSSVIEAIQWVSERFEHSDLCYGHGSDNPWDEACYLVLSAMKLPPDADESVGSLALTETAHAKILQWVDGRINRRIPLSYLVGEAWFCGLPFEVSPDVLIPRSPMAEWILQGFEPWLSPEKVTSVLDLCTGSGCIAIACAYAFPHAHVVGVDISPEALVIAERNRHRHADVADRVRFQYSDVFEQLSVMREDRASLDAGDNQNLHGNQDLHEKKNLHRGKIFHGDLGPQFDLIIANPPYVDAAEMAALPDEFRHEPELGLASGEDGLDVTRRILMGAGRYLAPGGILVCEVGASREALENAYPELPFVWLDFEDEVEGVFLLERKFLLGL